MPETRPVANTFEISLLSIIIPLSAQTFMHIINTAKPGIKILFLHTRIIYASADTFMQTKQP